MDLAVVLRHAGQEDDATAAEGEAVSLYERKGNAAAIATARQPVAAGGASTPAAGGTSRVK